MDKETNCTICEKPNPTRTTIGTSLNHSVKCRLCGDYEINLTLESVLPHEHISRRKILSAYIRAQKDAGFPPVKVREYNYKKIIDETALPSVLEKIELLILYIGDKSEGEFGRLIALDSSWDHSITYSPRHQEFEEIQRFLEKEGLVERLHDQTQNKDFHKLTHEGWAKYYGLKKNRIDSLQCFVAMSFNPSLDDIYESAIKKAVEDTGFKPLRLDKIKYSDVIDNKMLYEIKRSRFMVADFTDLKGGVYYEAGYAKGLGKNVIYSCQDTEENKKRLHFDVNHLPFLFWKDSNHLYEELVAWIGATILKPEEINRIGQLEK